MDMQVLFAIIIIMVALLGFLAYWALTRNKGVSLEKAKPVEPAEMIDEGVVARIGIVSSDWGPRAHILLEEKPGKPISVWFDSDHSAFPLTQVGDRVRIERNSDDDEDGDNYRFTNLTLGITVTTE